MSQAQLAKRCGIKASNIARIEAGRCDVRVGTLRRLFDAMFCDLVVFPRPRQRPGDALVEQYSKKPWLTKVWE